MERAGGGCPLTAMLASEQKGEPAMEDLGDWAHHQSPDTVICKVCLCHTCCWPPDTVACIRKHVCMLSLSWWMTCCSGLGTSPCRSSSAQTSRVMRLR
jgi:hypothetical protein